MSPVDATYDISPAPRTSPEERALVYVEPRVEVEASIGAVLDRWLEDEVKSARAFRDSHAPRLGKWRKTLDGKRAIPSVRRGSANISVPFCIWARTGVRARLDQGIFEARPILTVKPTKGRNTPADASPQTASNALAKLLISEIMNNRGLGGRAAIAKVVDDATTLGMGGWKITPEADVIKHGRPSAQYIDGTVVRKGGTRWSYIAFEDLIWCEGYGLDVNAMPLVGHEFDRTWTELQQWAALGHYDREAVARVEAFYTQTTKRGRAKDRPAALRSHRIAELHLDYDIDGDGIPESIILDWHIEARVRLRTIWQYTSDCRRPIVIVNFDMPSDLMSAMGQGIMAKLEGAQDEIDAVHNIAVESGKRAGAFVAVLKAGTRAEEDFGGDEEVIPGDTVVTENPEEDFVPRALGEPDAAVVLLQLEEHTRGYAMEILGMDKSRLGDMESGKRVSAQVGMTTFREGRVPIKNSLVSFASALQESCYLTIDLWRTRLSPEALASVLTPEEITELQASVFSLTNAEIRSNFLIVVNAEDAATLQEAKKNELMALNQFLMGFYDRVQQLILAIANPQVPPAAKRALSLLVERMERGVEALLQTLDSLPAPEELLIKVGALQEMLVELQGPVPGAPVAPPLPPHVEVATADLGGGVA